MDTHTHIHTHIHTYIRTGSLGQEHDIRISVPFMRDTTRARARKYGKDAGLSRTCDNEVGVAISIRDPYTSPFTSRCK